MKKNIISILLTLHSCFLYSQSAFNQIDSLNLVLGKQNLKAQFSTLIQISNVYARTNLDSSKHYAKKAYDLSRNIDDDSIKIEGFIFLGHRSWERGDYKEAISNFKKSLSLSEKTNRESKMADSYNGLGIVNSKLGNLNTSISFYFKTLKIYEKYKDSSGIGATYLNIAWDYKKMKEFNKSMLYNNKCLNIYTSLKDSLHIAMVNNNIAGSLNELGKYKKSLNFSRASKAYLEKLQYMRYTAYPLTNIGVSYDSLHDYNKAKINYLKAIRLHTENREPYELAFLNNALANLNYNIKDYENAIIKGKEAFNVAKEANAIDFIASSSLTLAKAYEKKGNYKTSNNYLKISIKYNDSILNSEKFKTISELETKYETEKKEKKILSQRADLAERELSLNKKNTQLIGLVLLVLVVSFLGYLLFKQQKLKNQQLKKEGELKAALVKIETQNRLQEQRLSISRDLHDNIGAQLTFIISSIESLQYGFKIKNEKLTNKLLGISRFTRDTIYELRDTIWAMNKTEISLTDLQIRISNFLDKAEVSSSAIHFNFNIDKSLSKDLEFTSVVGMNLYRIIQEAIHNAVKYSEATTVLVHILKAEKNIKIEIKDNGKGFNENEVELGNGLNNMRKRAKEIDALINIGSQVNKGTSVLINLPF